MVCLVEWGAVALLAIVVGFVVVLAWNIDQRNWPPGSSF